MPASDCKPPFVSAGRLAAGDPKPPAEVTDPSAESGRSPPRAGTERDPSPSFPAEIAGLRSPATSAFVGCQRPFVGRPPTHRFALGLETPDRIRAKQAGPAEVAARS